MKPHPSCRRRLQRSLLAVHTIFGSLIFFAGTLSLEACTFRDRADSLILAKKFDKEKWDANLGSARADIADQLQHNHTLSGLDTRELKKLLGDPDDQKAGPTLEEDDEGFEDESFEDESWEYNLKNADGQNVKLTVLLKRDRVIGSALETHFKTITKKGW